MLTSGPENSMYGYWKFVLRMGTTVALLAGTATLMTTQASAQFNIEGIVRGAISQGCCGGGYSRRHYGGVHEFEARPSVEKRRGR